MLISELETPAVVIDLDVVDQNLARMAAYCREHKLAMRTHTKSNKSPECAQRQIASGAIGITVAKLGEAEVMLNAGIADMLIAYPIVGEEKTTRLARIAELAKSIAELPGLEFKGLMFFPGHFTVGPEQRVVLREQVNDFLDRALETFARAELPLKIVSGGSTPTAYESSLFHGVNEVRPGM